MADIQINELLESTTAANSDWIAIDNGSATKKISVQNFNATGAASAAQSAAAAASCQRQTGSRCGTGHRKTQQRKLPGTDHLHDGDGISGCPSGRPSEFRLAPA